jgi:hypothetical protein
MLTSCLPQISNLNTMFKGIISSRWCVDWDHLCTRYSLVLNNPLRNCLTQTRADRGNMRCLDRGLPQPKQPYCRLPQTGVSVWERIAAGLSCPHVFHAFWARSLAIRSALESSLPRSYSCCGKPRYFTPALSKWVNSSILHFKFYTSLLFEARLFRCKTDPRRIVMT